MDKTDYIREWRRGNQTARDNQTRAARARRNALAQLAARHATEFKTMLNAHRKEEGLPPVR